MNQIILTAICILIVLILIILIIFNKDKIFKLLKLYFKFIPSDLLIHQQVSVHKGILNYKSIDIFENSNNININYDIKKEYELNHILKLIKELTYFPYSDCNVKTIINCDNKKIYLLLSNLFFNDTRIGDYAVVSDSVRSFSWNTYGSSRYQIVEIVYTHNDERSSI